MIDSQILNLLNEQLCEKLGIMIEKEGEFAYRDFDERRFVEKTLTFATNVALIKKFYADPRVSAILCDESAYCEVKNDLDSKVSKGIYLHSNARKSFFELHSSLNQMDIEKDTKVLTTIGKGCDISDLACVASHEVVIGNNVVIEAGCIIKERVVIGDDCFIGAGSVLGGDGFQYMNNSNDVPVLVPHIGRVTLGKGVHLHSMVSVDYAIFAGATSIGDHCKIDSLVKIAHAASVGNKTLIASGATICGGAVIGQNVWVGPNATISDSINVGSDASVSLGSVVVRDVPEGTKVTGNMAMPHHQFMKFMASAYTK